MTTRRATAIIPTEDDIDDEPLLTPAERRGHEHWLPEVKHQLSALLLQGVPLRAAARQLGVPRATAQAWKVSTDDPIVRAMHREHLTRLMYRCYEIGADQVERVATSPTPPAQHAAVSAGILLDKALLLAKALETVKDGEKVETMMDLFPAMARQRAEIKRLQALVDAQPIRATITSGTK